MRHVMVKIELDSRLGLEEVDTMMGRGESGRVCVVCTRYVCQAQVLVNLASNFAEILCGCHTG